jgi:acyl-CoA dehydrogenase
MIVPKAFSSVEQVGQTVRDVAEKQLTPLAENFGERSEVCRPLVRLMGDLGFFRLLDLDADEAPWFAAHRWSAHAAVREALALVDSQCEEIYTIQGLGIYPILLMGTQAQQERFLRPLQAGERISAFALSEPDAGSDIASMTTTAHRVDGGWAISGDKTWISHAPDADTYVVFARHEQGSGVDGVSAFIVEKGASGFQLEPSLDLLSPHAIGTLHFRDCFVPDDQVLGDLGRGLHTALKSLQYFRPSVGARAVGLSRRALDVATEWAREREVFGGPLIDQQTTAFKLADMAIRIHAARAIVYDAARRADAGEDIAVAGSAAKAFATETAQSVAYDAQQICGGRGVLAGHPAERIYRQVRAMTIYEGTSEIQRLIVSRHIRRGTLNDTWGF